MASRSAPLDHFRSTSTSTHNTITQSAFIDTDNDIERAETHSDKINNYVKYLFPILLCGMAIGVGGYYAIHYAPIWIHFLSLKLTLSHGLLFIAVPAILLLTGIGVTTTTSLCLRLKAQKQ